jgi:hypothetical protein
MLALLFTLLLVYLIFRLGGAVLNVLGSIAKFFIRIVFILLIVKLIAGLLL